MDIERRKKLKELRNKAEVGKGKEYKWFYARFSFALIRDKHLAKIGANAFAVYLVIFTFKNRQNISHPSLKTIGNLSGIKSPNTIRGCIVSLEKSKWLKATKGKKGNDGKYQNTEYELLQLDLIRSSETKEGFIERPISDFDND